MRIRKGTQVEVWMQEAGSPVGAWRVGEVTWGNGHSYTLRWHDGGGGGEEVSGRISRKSVRPRPPPAPVPRDLDAGDMVEVFDDDDCLWKCAEVVQGAAANDRRHFDVKIVGAAKVLTVPPQRLRVRQILRPDDVWVALHKDNHVVAVQSAMHPRAVVGRMGAGRGKGGYKAPPMAPGSTPFLQKRTFGGMLGPASNTSSHHGEMRFEDDAKRFKQEPRCGAQEPIPNVCVNNKQDEMSGEDCDNDVGTGVNLHPSDDDADDDHGHQQQERKEDKEMEDDDDDDDDDTDSDSSSDDSSSSSSSSSDSDSRTRSMDAGGEDCAAAAPTTRPHDDHEKAGQLQQPAAVKKEQPMIIKEEQTVKREQRCDDDDVAESREMKSEPPTKDDQDQMGAATVREHIHHLELEAYAALMKAFHACGDALSWEKEGLLSDLRVHLHVSNDEHLQVLNVILNRKRRAGGPR